MYTIFFFAKNKSMKMSTKIFLIIFVLALIPAIILGKSVLEGIIFASNTLSFNFSTEGIIGLVLFGITAILGIILYVRFVKSLSFDKVVFFSSLPLIVIYGLVMFLLADLTSLNNPFAQTIKNLLNISGGDDYNTILWAVLITIIFVILLYINYIIICRPMNKMEKVIVRLGDGLVRDNFNIGGSKQFRNIEHGLNKINSTYKKEGYLNLSNDRNNKLPKPAMKFLGKDGILALERDGFVNKYASLLFISLKSNDESENFQDRLDLLNNYKDKIYPIAKKYGGFVNNFSSAGISIVFPKSELAIKCSRNIYQSFKDRRGSAIKVKSILHSLDLRFVYDKKSKNLIVENDISLLIEKFMQILDYMKVYSIFTRQLLDDLSIDVKVEYRMLGSIEINGENYELFEDLQVYNREYSLKLISDKRIFEKAVILYNQGDYKKAVYYFEQLLRSCPDDYPSYVYFNKTKEKIAV